MQEFLSYHFFGNTIEEYLAAIGILMGGMVAIFVFKKCVLCRLKILAAATETLIDDLLVTTIQKSLIPIFYFGILYLALHSLTLSPRFEKVLGMAAAIFLTIYAAKAVIYAVNFGLRSYIKSSTDAAGEEKHLKGISGLLNFAIWTLALVFLLDNLGVKISAVVAGLGIGGIAVALAAQAVLGDLFSYFVIFFDKPFEIGDFIVIGDKMGAVEYIGIKTTRIRAIGGEQLVFSNTDLTNSRVHNFKKMERRRVVFTLGVIYQTTSAQLKLITQIVKAIIDKQEGSDFDRGHFAAFGASSLDFEFVYYVTGADYAIYMDIQQAINLAILEAFEKENIEFAYPTQTLFVNKAN